MECPLPVQGGDGLRAVPMSPEVPGAFPVLPARDNGPGWAAGQEQGGSPRWQWHGTCPSWGKILVPSSCDGTIGVPGTAGKHHTGKPCLGIWEFWCVPAGSRGREGCVTPCALLTPGDNLGVLHSFISAPSGSCHVPRVSSANVSCCWQLVYFHFRQDLGHSFVSGFWKGKKRFRHREKKQSNQEKALLSPWQNTKWSHILIFFFFWLWANCFCKTGKRP